MPERRTIAAICAAVVVLGVVLALLLTASTDSSLGRVRAQIGNAADSVGNALSAPSPPPTPTASPTPTAEEVLSRDTAVSVRRLLASAGASLDGGDDAGRRAALQDYNRIRASISRILPADDYAGLYDRADALRERLAGSPVTPAP